MVTIATGRYGHHVLLPVVWEQLKDKDIVLILLLLLMAVIVTIKVLRPKRKAANSSNAQVTHTLEMKI